MTNTPDEPNDVVALLKALLIEIKAMNEKFPEPPKPKLPRKSRKNAAELKTFKEAKQNR